MKITVRGKNISITEGIENKIRWGLLRVFGQSRFYRLAG